MRIENVRVSVLLIGDELLLGQVIDSNSAQMAKLLYPYGLQVYRKYCIADDEEEIIQHLHLMVQFSDLILITGGLGPTRDDVSKKALAKFLNQKIIFNEQHKEHVVSMLERRGRPVNELQLSQCYVPEFAEMLDNPLGTAMGLWMKYGTTEIVSMPGVPYEMEVIMNGSVLPRISKMQTSGRIVHKTICTAGMGETDIALRIEPVLKDMPDFIKLAYLPSLGQVRLRLTGTSSDVFILNDQIEMYAQLIRSELYDIYLGDEDTSLESEIGILLNKLRKTISTAESCTGGSIAKRITSIAGSSDYFMGSIVAYQNKIKTALLEVPEEILATEGAVSEACVRHMVLGACKLMGSDFAIASSGIAGPGGGTEQKPVGTVWIACGNKNDLETNKLNIHLDRIRNIEYATNFALQMIWRQLKNMSKP